MIKKYLLFFGLCVMMTTFFIVHQTAYSQDIIHNGFSDSLSGDDSFYYDYQLNAVPSDYTSLSVTLTGGTVTGGDLYMDVW